MELILCEYLSLDFLALSRQIAFVRGGFAYIDIIPTNER